MKRRREVPEAIGLSVLDLVCGLFGMLVVLYATTERVTGAPGVLSEKLNLVSIQLDDAIDASMGLEIRIGGEVFRSWPSCINYGPLTWLRCEDGVIEAVIENSEDGIEALGILALSHPKVRGTAMFDDVDVWVSAPEFSGMCQIGFTTQYRMVIGAGTECVSP